MQGTLAGCRGAACILQDSFQTPEQVGAGLQSLETTTRGDSVGVGCSSPSAVMWMIKPAPVLSLWRSWDRGQRDSQHLCLVGTDAPLLLPSTFAPSLLSIYMKVASAKTLFAMGPGLRVGGQVQTTWSS